eukprot:4977994-Heterocapsa_arctica.AAC.1
MDIWRVHKMTPLPENWRPPPGLDSGGGGGTVENRAHLRHCYLEVLKKEAAAAAFAATATAAAATATAARAEW